MSYKSYLDKILNENENLKIVRHSKAMDGVYELNLVEFSKTFYAIKEYKDGTLTDSTEYRDLKTANEHYNKLKACYGIGGMKLIEIRFSNGK